MKTAGNARWWFWLFLFAVPLFASLNQTLPTWHWAYDVIRDLRIRVVLPELSDLEQPYTRGDVARAVMSFRKKMDNGQVKSDKMIRQLVERLETEFAVEIDQLDKEELGKKGTPLSAGLRLQPDIVTDEESTELKGMYRSKLSVDLTENITVYNAIAFDRYSAYDSLYVGKKWRNLVAYTEQGYITMNFRPFFLKFGRDFLRWGPGGSGTLFFSNLTRPLDQFVGSFTAGPFTYTFFTGFLDAMKVPVGEEAAGDSALYQRYAAAHRMTGRFFKGRLELALTEAVLYGGRHRGLDWVYLNPFVVYYDAELNRTVKDNKFVSLELAAYPFRNFRVAGSFLIDDIQIEKTRSGDLEPNEIGFNIHTDWADPVGLSGATISAEYVRVTNRTYKTANPWETFLHRNQPLGHPLGNDFDLIQAGVSKWFGADLWMGVQYEHVRKGEGSIYTPWDAPWKDKTLEEGYSEPFPTGVVEKRDHIRLEFRYQPGIHWGIQGEVVSSLYQNYQHVQDVEESFFEWRIGVWWDGEFLVMF